MQTVLLCLLSILLIAGVAYYWTKEGAYVLTLQPTSIMPSLYSDQLYEFYRGKEFPDQINTIFTRKDLVGNIPAMMALCDTMPNCAGFCSTSGDFKRHILGPDYFAPIMAPFTCGPADGIYVKARQRCIPPSCQLP